MTIARLAIALVLVGCTVDAAAHPHACGDDGGCPPGRRCHRPEGLEQGLCVLDEVMCVPSAEVCNGLNDDCDAAIDEGFDLTTAERCGACDVTCAPPNELCVSDGSGGYVCGSECDRTRFTDCGGGSPCVDTALDELHCGGCGVRCDPGEDCIDGTCRCGETGDDCAGTTTSTCCGTVCANLNTSPEHCGACGSACARSGGARVACEAQVCDCGDCRDPSTCANLILLECL